MVGDGTNDAPALANADVAVAMNTGTMAAREAGNMIDLDSNPTKLIEIVEVGKQILITRGSLTTFSITNDIAKYFAIIPAMFVALYVSGHKVVSLGALNIMRLTSPQTAILSAIIFNALIIPNVYTNPRNRQESNTSLALVHSILIFTRGSSFHGYYPYTLTPSLSSQITISLEHINLTPMPTLCPTISMYPCRYQMQRRNYHVYKFYAYEWSNKTTEAVDKDIPA